MMLVFLPISVSTLLPLIMIPLMELLPQLTKVLLDLSLHLSLAASLAVAELAVAVAVAVALAYTPLEKGRMLGYVIFRPFSEDVNKYIIIYFNKKKNDFFFLE